MMLRPVRTATAMRPGWPTFCLVGQMYNAHRFNCNVEPYPTLNRIVATCLARPEFDAARPENQPDAPAA